MERPDRAFVDALLGARSVILTGHEHPDGDCLGAQVALYHLLRGLGRDVRIHNPDPAPRAFTSLTSHTPFGFHDAGLELPRCDLLVLLDCAEVSRLGRLRAAVERARPRIAVVDHHLGSELGDGDVAFVDVDAAATGELVHRLFKELGRDLTVEAAEGIFVSLVSDTGWFRYSNTSSRVFAIAAELAEIGVDTSAVYDALHRRNDPASVKLLADAIARSEISPDGRFGWITLDRVIIERAAAIGLDLDLVMEPLRSVDGIEVVAMLKEAPDGIVKVSLRASGDVDVQAIARRFGGGGHRKAAGAAVRGGLEQILRSLRDDVQSGIAAAGAAANGVP